MKPSNGKQQTATQVNVLSPEILHFRGADSFHVLEGRMRRFDMTRNASSSRDLRQWYAVEQKRQELGRSELSCAGDSPQGRRGDAENIRVRTEVPTPYRALRKRMERAQTLNNPKRRERCHGCSEVGFARSSNETSNDRGAKGRKSERSGEKKQVASLRGYAA